jgi:hypothetical protein
MICKRCNIEDSLPREKYCKKCRKQVLAELSECGYLQSLEGTSHFKTGLGGKEHRDRTSLQKDLWSENSDGIEEYIDSQNN